jgi:hypothetical protein
MTGCVKTRPSTSSLSSIVPPTFLMMRMFLRSTLSAVLRSIVLVTALTAMGPRRFEYWETILEEREVLAAWRRAAVSVREMGCDMSCRTWTAAAAALWNDSEMTEGWMPLVSNLSAAPSRLPQITTTEVVPSPASTSWAFDSWTSILAVGCITDMLLSMVLPSFVMMVSPLPLRIILSIPRGPKDVLMASATAVSGQHRGAARCFSGVVPLAATIFDDRTASGFSLSCMGGQQQLDAAPLYHVHHGGVSTLNAAFPPPPLG